MIYISIIFIYCNKYLTTKGFTFPLISFCNSRQNNCKKCLQ